MSFLYAALFVLFFVYLYRRYVPVCGVPCTKLTNPDSIMVDLRDYPLAAKNPILGAISIPIAYLNRYNTEITGIKVHVIASNQLEKNIGIRLLRKKGFNVIGYMLTDCPCKKIA